MRYLGLDIGDRWIGVAAGDTASRLTSPLRTLRRSTRRADVDTIRRLCWDEGTTTVVVGLPRNMDGSLGPQARRTCSFAAALRAAGLTVAWQDERLSSAAAAEYVTATRGRRPRPGERLDHVAAALILQDYLDNLGRDDDLGRDAAMDRDDDLGRDAAKGVEECRVIRA